ncbi:MAG: ABC transporter substrate-binding protein [Burkholderiales bacterium]
MTTPASRMNTSLAECARRAEVCISRRHAGLAMLLASIGDRSLAAEQVVRIGVLGVFLWDPADPSAKAFMNEVSRRGYVLGRNLTFVSRACGNELRRLDGLAGELVALKVDLIWSTGGTPSALAAKRATTTIPIVMSSRDPVEDGLVESLAKPGGNVTGSADIGQELTLKRLQLLLEAVGDAKPIGYLIHPRILERKSERRTIAAMESSMHARGGRLVVAAVREVSQGDDLEYGLALLQQQGVGAALINNYSTIGADEERTADILLRHQLPAMMENRPYAVGGVMMTYSEPVEDDDLRSASFIDRILKGAKPRDLPIERPTRFELSINLRTARKLGIVIPAALLLRADEVIR